MELESSLERFEYTLIFFSFSIGYALPVFAGRAVLLREGYLVAKKPMIIFHDRLA
jgi:hypothetical protein